MYRPKNWKNPYPVDLGDASAILEDMTPLWKPEANQAYEAGADAMLDGLMKLPVSLKKDGQTWLIDPAFATNAWKKGYLVFIPDKQVKKDE